MKCGVRGKDSAFIVAGVVHPVVVPKLNCTTAQLWLFFCRPSVDPSVSMGFFNRTNRQGDMAVRLALGETHLIKENKEYFEKEGVDISVLESAKAKGGGKGAEERSSTVILVKNLPYSTEAAELAKRFGAFGDVSTTASMLFS